MFGLQCRNGLIADIVVCASMSQLSNCRHCCMCSMVHSSVHTKNHPHKMFFNILGNGYNMGEMVHSSVHPIKCFYILGNCDNICYKIGYRVHSSVHPIKCFNILCSVFNVAMVSWLTLLYVWSILSFRSSMSQLSNC